MSEIIYQFSGLTKLDELELKQDPNIEFKTAPIPEGSHGELATLIAFVVVASLPTIAAYLLRTRDDEIIEEDYVEIHPDGRKVKRRFRYNRKQGAAPEKDIVEQFTNGTSQFIGEIPNDGIS